MVLDRYNTENVHNEFKESFMMVHLDSIGIMGALAGTMFIMFLSYKMCKSKGMKRYINVCCSRCCETRGAAGGRRDEIIHSLGGGDMIEKHILFGFLA